MSYRPSPFFSRRCHPSRQGFTLVELLMVIGIMVLIGVMSMPALSSILMGSARKTAVNELLGAFENARVEALTYGVNTYIAFANNDAVIPAADRYHAYIIFREATPDEQADNGAVSYVQLTKWNRLPQGISFYSSVPSMVTPDDNNGWVTVSTLPAPGRSHAATMTLPCVEFSPTGSVSAPAVGPSLRLFVYEGTYSNGDHFTASNRNLLDRILLAHYTGRVSTDVTSPTQAVAANP